MFAPGAQTPRPPGTVGKRVPCGAKGSVSPVGCCRQRRQSDPKRGSETMSTTVRKVRMIEQPGHLREAQSDPKVRRKEACALWALGPKVQSNLEA